MEDMQDLKQKDGAELAGPPINLQTTKAPGATKQNSVNHVFIIMNIVNSS